MFLFRFVFSAAAASAAESSGRRRSSDEDSNHNACARTWRRRTGVLRTPAVGAQDIRPGHEEAAANQRRRALVALETVVVPVTLVERDELGRAQTCSTNSCDCSVQLVTTAAAAAAAEIFIYATYDRGSVLLRRRCDTLCASGFMDDVVFVWYRHA